MEAYVIGVDFGTDSVRVLLVNALTGREISQAVHLFPRWNRGEFCDATASLYRQHPLDYLESLDSAMLQVLAEAGPLVVSKIVGISVDTTGSTPVAVDSNGTPLALLPAFSQNPNAMFVLWKDHTAHEEAAEINRLAHRWKTDYTKYSGGTYSPEWFWAKILHIVRSDDQVAQAAYSWVEHCDWMPAVLTGNTNPLTWKRSRCAAGHKAMWHEDFEGLPSEDFLSTLDARLAGLRKRLYRETYTADQPAGMLSSYYRQRWGLPEGVMIGVGGIDAHFGAVGACIEPFTLVKVVGTSTCDMLIAPIQGSRHHLIRGICGQVDGSIVPGMLGMEAGQSAFGDLYAWLQQLLFFPIEEFLDDKLSTVEKEQLRKRILPTLDKRAAALPVTEQDIVALDWINGRRTPDADLSQTGIITGLRLGMGAPYLLKAFVEATAFGSRAIVQRFHEEGVPIRKILALGGIAKKSPYVMQTLANVLNLPIHIVRTEQACALGAAMYAATVAKVHPSIGAAQHAMTSGIETVYFPEGSKVKVYDKLYDRYCALARVFSTPFREKDPQDVQKTAFYEL